MDLINDFILAAAASPWLLLVMFAVAVIDGFFPPAPSETVLVAAAAVAAASGDLAVIVPLGLVAAAGAVIGDNIAYALGRKVGITRFAWMRRPRVASAFARAQGALDRRSGALILGARYIPVGRVAVNMSAGALQYPWRRFLPLSVLAALTWSAHTIVIGLVAGNWIKDQPLLGAAMGVLLTLVLGLVIDRIAAARRRRAESATAPADTASAASAPTSAGPRPEPMEPAPDRELCPF